MNWVKVKIGKLFNIEKGELQSTKNTAGKYPFITAAENWKTNNTYSHDSEALIFAAAASGSLGRTHHIKGKFISSDLCFILTPKDEHNYPIDLKFYYFVFNSLKEDIVRTTKSGTSKESINYTNFSNYELYYFDIGQQHLWINKLIYIDGKKDELLKELSDQNKYLQLLDKTILQDAVQGKLTKQDPSDEPASELLKQIKSEKQELIKAGKLKKEKELPPITEDEIPFQLPEGWVWCRLGEVCNLITDGTHLTPRYVEKGRKFFSAQNVKPFKFLPDNQKYVSEQDYQGYIKTRKAEKGDVLLTRVGAGIGEAAVIDLDVEFAFYVSLGLLKFKKQCINSYYMELYLNSPLGRSHSRNRTLGKGVSAGNLNLNLIRQFEFPLPPIAEQQRIVNKFTEFQKKLAELQLQIDQSRKLSEQFLQGVLNEAFNRKKKFEEKEELTMAADF
jgi:type I restriction enzyme, S subunit